jgi:hypothetical protein
MYHSPFLSSLFFSLLLSSSLFSSLLPSPFLSLSPLTLPLSLSHSPLSLPSHSSFILPLSTHSSHAQIDLSVLRVPETPYMQGVLECLYILGVRFPNMANVVRQTLESIITNHATNETLVNRFAILWPFIIIITIFNYLFICKSECEFYRRKLMQAEHTP